MSFNAWSRRFKNPYLFWLFVFYMIHTAVVISTWEIGKQIVRMFYEMGW